MRFRKILSVILAALFFMTPMSLLEVRASAANYSGSNVGKNNYNNWSRPVTSYLTTANGGYMRVQAGAVDGKVVVQYYDNSFKFKSEKQVAYGLPYFGAFYETEDNYYLLSGQSNLNEDDSVEVYRVTKFDKSWSKLGTASLYGENTYIPFDAGSARMTHLGKYLVIRTCHEMYQSSDGLHHQANVTFEIDTSTMKVTDKFTGVMNTSVGYCSHSFNQFIKIDGKNVVGVDHGDAYPRSVALIKYPTDMSSGNFYSNLDYWTNSCRVIPMLSISGDTGNNYTGANVGGFEISDSSYIVVGRTIDQSKFGTSYDLPKNIYVSTVDRACENEPKIRYITNYNDTTASNPFLVKISDSRFLVIWEHNDYVYYQEINDMGETVGKQYSLKGQLSDCQPIVSGGKVMWYVWNDSVKFYSFSVPRLPQISGLKSDIGDTSVTLSWSKNTSASYYKVWTWKDGKLTLLKKTNSLTYTASSLTPNTSYEYRVTAYNSRDNAIAYSDITAKTKYGTIASLKAAPSNSSVKLTWSKNTAASYYKVFIWKDSKWTQLTKTGSNATVAHTISGLAANTSYKFRVTAYNISGKAIAYSDITSKTYGNIANLKAAPTDSSVKLTWSKNTAAAYYKVWTWKNDKLTLLTKTGSNATVAYTASNLAVNTSYKFRVTAYNSSGKVIAYSDITTTTRYGTIANLKAVPAKNSVKLTWGKNASASYYKVWTWESDKLTQLTKTDSNATVAYTASKLTANTSYKFRVTAYNSSGKAIAYSDITAKTTA